MPFTLTSDIIKPMVKTHEKKLKIIVFDFDETLYYHPRALEFCVEFIKNAICSLSSRNGDEAMKIIREYGFDRRGEKRVSFGKTCGKFGIDEKAWDEYKLSHFFEVDYDGADTVDNKLLIELAKKYTLVILSNELYENIIYKSERLEIDLSVFDRIYAPSVADGGHSVDKKESFKKICEDYGAEPDELFALGDRYQVDVAPLVELGGAGVQISSVADAENIIKTKLM